MFFFAFCISENFVFETILASVFAACVLHVFWRFLSVAHLHFKFSFWSSSFVAELRGKNLDLRALSKYEKRFLLYQKRFGVF